MDKCTKAVLARKARSRGLALLATVAPVVLSTTAAAQAFDKLTACDDMATLRQAVDVDPPLCGRAQDRVARAIGTRVRTTTCFFKPRVQSLYGFECAQPPGLPQLTCFRPAPADAVERVRSNYTNGYDQVIARYFAAARQCDYSSGRVSPAPNNMITFSPLGWVAKAELAYGAETGRQGTSDGAVIHGFASTDPEAGLPPTVEFLHVYGVRCRSSDCLSFRPGASGDEVVERTDDLVLIREPEDESLRDLNRQMLRSGYPIRYHAASFRIDSTVPTSIQTLAQAAAWRRRMADLPARQSLAIRRVLSAIKAELLDDGFRRPSASELGGTKDLLDKLRQGKLASQPYALRSDVRSSDIEMLVKDGGGGCFRNGMMIVFYGSQGNTINIMSGGLADCKYRASSQLSRLSAMVSLSAR